MKANFARTRHNSSMLCNLVVAALYVALAKIGLLFALKEPTITIFWPVGGFALATLLYTGLKILPGIFTGAVIAGFIAVDVPVVALFLGVADTAETVLAAWMLQRQLAFSPALLTRRDFFKLTLVAAPVASSVSAFISANALTLGHIIPAEMLTDIGLRWWMGDVIGIGFMTPLLLFCHPRSWVKHEVRASYAELVLLYGLTFLFGQTIFFDWFQGLAFTPKGGAWLFMLMIWAALRSGRINTALLQLLIFTQALWSASHGMGHYADDMVQTGLANFWVFGLVVAIGGMALAVTSVENHIDQTKLAASEKALQEQRYYLSALIDNFPFMVWLKDSDGRYLAGNTKLADELGVKDFAQFVGKSDFNFFPNALAQKYYEDDKFVLHSKQQKIIEEEYMDANGVRKWVETYKAPVKNADGGLLGTVGFAKDISDQKQKELILRQFAETDYLTGINNRRHFVELAEQEINRATRYGNPLSLLMIDIDHFKRVNDEYGHKAGDQVLQRLADICRKTVREFDVLGRLGGEEFAILLHQTCLDEAYEVAERLRSAAEESISATEAADIRFTVSIGIASVITLEQGLDALLIMADKALYQAKNAGRNTVK